MGKEVDENRRWARSLAETTLPHFYKTQGEPPVGKETQNVWATEAGSILELGIAKHVQTDSISVSYNEMIHLNTLIMKLTDIWSGQISSNGRWTFFPGTPTANCIQRAKDVQIVAQAAEKQLSRLKEQVQAEE